MLFLNNINKFMNNPHIKNFLTSIERATEGQSDLALRSQRPALCPHLEQVERLLSRHVPKEQRVNSTATFTRMETMCIAGKMIFTFTFDDVPEFTSRNDQPLISKSIDRDEKIGLHGIATDYMRYEEERSWPKYNTYIKREIRRRIHPDEQNGYTADYFEKLDTLVGESDIDEHNIRIRQDLSSTFRGGDEDFMKHLNLNAHFFKRLFVMGMPGRNVDSNRNYHCGSFEEGLVSAKAITIGKFLDCSESRSGHAGNHREAFNSPRVYDKKDFSRPGVPDSDFNITRAGFLCHDVDGLPFVLVGCHGGGYNELFYSIENEVTLAIPFGPRLPKTNKRRRNLGQTRINDDEERRVMKFVESVSNYSSIFASMEGTLMRRANDVLFADMLSLANNYETMRCIWPENKSKSRLVVIYRRDIYVMSKQPYSNLIRDFPRFQDRELIPFEERDSDEVDMYGDWIKEDPIMPPTNENGTYYKIDKVESRDEGPHQQTFVAAAVDYCGFQRGRKVQPIKFIRPNGDVSTILAEFASAFD